MRDPSRPLVSYLPVATLSFGASRAAAQTSPADWAARAANERV
jgi:hypothetical protein